MFLGFLRHTVSRGNLSAKWLTSMPWLPSKDIIIRTTKPYEDMRRYLPAKLTLLDIDGSDLGIVEAKHAQCIAEERNMLITGIDHKSKTFRLISKEGLDELKRAQSELMKIEGIDWKKPKTSEIRLSTSIDARDMQLKAKNAEKLLRKGNSVIVNIRKHRFKQAYGVRTLFQSFLGMIPPDLFSKQQEHVGKDETKLRAELKPKVKPNSTGATDDKQHTPGRIMKFSFVEERVYYESKDGSESNPGSN